MLISIINSVALSTAFCVLLTKYEKMLWTRLAGYFLLSVGVGILFSSVLNFFPSCSLHVTVIALTVYRNVKQKNLLKSFLHILFIAVLLMMNTLFIWSIVDLAARQLLSINLLAYNIIFSLETVTFALLVRNIKNGSILEMELHLKGSVIIAIISFLAIYVTLTIIFPVFSNIIAAQAYPYIIILFTILFVIEIIFTSQVGKMEMEAIAMRLKYDFVKEKQQDIDKIIALKHYFFSLFQSCVVFIHNDDMEGFKEYFRKYIMPIHDDLLKDKEKTFQVTYIASQAIQNIIRLYIYKASLLPDVLFNLVINKPITKIPMDEMDLFQVLNIYLENAFNEVDEKGEICICFEEEETILHITITNTLSSRKVEKKLDWRFGQGLKIAEHLIDLKYENVLWRTEVNNERFTQVLSMYKDNPSISRRGVS